MKSTEPGKLKERSKKKLKKDKAKKEDEWEIDPGSDYPVHEKYAQEEPVKD